MTARRIPDEPQAVDTMSYRLPAALDGEVTATLEKWHASEGVRRLWARDASLWTGNDESRWLDWLNIVDGERNALREVTAFAQSVRHDFEHVVVLGMGGSSLCPDVLARTFGRVQEWPELHVLDSTDPAQIRTLQASIDVAKTLFIVSSKSGTTLEPNLLSDYFFDQVSQVLGSSQAAKHFIAVTDPGSPLQVIAEKQNFAHVFFGVPGIGGRYSALSNFGMVPAAMMGVDVRNFLDRAAVMVRACASSVSSKENSGALLGTILATSARSGRDKVTLVTSPGIASLGAWLEQLLAESTGKEGRGIIPIDGESLGAPEVYGRDRLFAYLRLDSAPDPQQDAAVRALENAGQPVVRIGLGEAHDIGQEFFRWEVATAVAGAILGINPFNQP
ncbi:MAG: transaldolase, partial [Polyangiaceae bacterium]